MWHGFPDAGRSLEWEPFSGTPFRLNLQGSELVEVKEEYPDLDIELIAGKQEAIRRCKCRLDDLRVVGSSWMTMLPQHKYVEQLNIDVARMVTRATIAMSLFDDETTSHSEETINNLDKQVYGLESVFSVLEPVVKNILESAESDVDTVELQSPLKKAKLESAVESDVDIVGEKVESDLDAVGEKVESDVDTAMSIPSGRRCESGCEGCLHMSIVVNTVDASDSD